MRFHKYPIASHGHCRPTYGFNHLGVTARHATSLIGALQRVCDIHHHRHLVPLHNRHSPEIHYQILVAECGASFCQHHVVVAKIVQLVHRMHHGLGRQELPFLHIDAFSCLRSRLQQRRLSAQECRYLEHIHIFGGHCGLLFGVDVGHHGYAILLAYGLQYLQPIKVANARKRVHSRPIGLAVRRLECKGNL